MSSTESSNLYIEAIKPNDPHHLSLIEYVAIDVYCESEPVTLGFHATPDEMREFLMPGVIEWVNSGLSVMVRNTNKKDEVVGVMLCKTLTKESTGVYGSLPANNQKTRMYKNICNVAESAYNPYTSEIINVMEQALLSVKPEYRGMGLGFKMAKKCDEIGMNAGCQLGMVTATNVATRKIFQKLGYAVVHTLDYKTFKIDDKLVLDISAGNGTTELNILIKKY